MTRGMVLAIGGTRGVGREIARRLAGLADWEVRILARDPIRARRDLPENTDICRGDLTQPQSLFPAVRGVSHIVFTAGAPSGRYASEDLVRRTDYEGVLHTLAAAREERPVPRFLYLNSMGVEAPSLAGAFINALKRNTMVWRRRVEDEIRASELPYSIIRVGFLLNRPAGCKAIDLRQDSPPLSFARKIARADVAEAFIAALDAPNTVHTTFDIAWGRGPRRDTWPDLFARLQQDR